MNNTTKKKKLIRTHQCAKCPFKVRTNPYDIPKGYCPTKHEALKETIADGIQIFATSIKAMACHHSNGNDDMYCVGWLNQQLGVGNNIPLRLLMMNYENAKDIKVVGKQHETFEATLPQNKNCEPQ
jgi:hypothetical protein